MASLVAAGLIPTPTLPLSFDVTFSSCPKGAYSCVGEVMGGEVLWGDVASVPGADAWGTLSGQPRDLVLFAIRTLRVWE
jgi:hypothetical protein